MKDCFCRACLMCQPKPENCEITYLLGVIEKMAVALVDTVEIDGTYFNNRNEVKNYYLTKK